MKPLICIAFCVLSSHSLFGQQGCYISVTRNCEEYHDPDPCGGECGQIGAGCGTIYHLDGTVTYTALGEPAPGADGKSGSREGIIQALCGNVRTCTCRRVPGNAGAALQCIVDTGLASVVGDILVTEYFPDGPVNCIGLPRVGPGGPLVANEFAD